MTRFATDSLRSLGPADWQTELSESYTDPDALLRDLGLDPDPTLARTTVASGFPFRVTRSFARRMTPREPNDPLLLQVLPGPAELREASGYSADPVGDRAAVAVPGLLHKYQGRVLLVLTGACAIHCRYCFRREFPYLDLQLSHKRERGALAYIATDPSIREVILSGGDPLVLSDDRLRHLIAALETIPHLKRLRIHSRLPVVLPSRITADLQAILARSRLKPVIVIHANHPAELDAEVGASLARLRGAGLTLLNQSVLLHGINDRSDILIELSEVLFEHGVLPYYLHLLDPARGTSHFAVTDSAAIALIGELRAHLPGYLVPKLVREIAGEPYKSAVS